MFERFRRDLRRLFEQDEWGERSLLAKAETIFHSPQIHAIAIYRFGHWVRQNVENRALRTPLKIAYHLADKTVHALWGIHIDDRAEIGGGLYIGHPGLLLVGPVTMGEDCNLSPNTIIGRRSDGSSPLGAPTIGDRVWIGAGSVVFGPIAIGDGATIGPLTVVGRNVAPRSLVLGNPMQVVKRDYDNTRQIYGRSEPSGNLTR